MSKTFKVISLLILTFLGSAYYLNSNSQIKSNTKEIEKINFLKEENNSMINIFNPNRQLVKEVNQREINKKSDLNLKNEKKNLTATDLHKLKKLVSPTSDAKKYILFQEVQWSPSSEESINETVYSYFKYIDVSVDDSKSIELKMEGHVSSPKLTANGDKLYFQLNTSNNNIYYINFPPSNSVINENGEVPSSSYVQLTNSPIQIDTYKVNDDNITKYCYKANFFWV